MNKIEIMKKGYTGEQLTSKALNMTVGKGDKIVALEEVEDALAQEVHDYTDVTSVIEAFSEMNATVSVGGVVGLQCRQHAKFYPAGISVLLDRTNDLDRNVVTPSLAIFSLNHFAKGALSEQLYDLVLLGEVASRCHNIVAILIVIIRGLSISMIRDDLHGHVCNLLHRLGRRLVAETRITQFFLSPSRLLGDLLSSGPFPLLATTMFILIVVGLRHAGRGRYAF